MNVANAWVVLNNDVHIATVHALCTDTGVVCVDVFTDTLIHQGRVHGDGHDKFTAALAGAEIAGVKLCDHGEERNADGTYTTGGLARLTELGYTVIQVL